MVCFHFSVLLLAFFLVPSHTLAGTKTGPLKSITSGMLTLEFDSGLRSRISSPFKEPFLESETITLENESGEAPLTFTLVENETTPPPQENSRLELIGTNSRLEKKITLWIDPSFPGAVFLKVRYTNISKGALKISRWENARHSFGSVSDDIWSYQPGTYEERPNWILPVPKGFKQENFLGMNATDYGGGTPLSALWNKKNGLSVGASELKPKQNSLPITRSSRGTARLSLQEKMQLTLKPKAFFETSTTFLFAFHGDAFQPLQAFASHLKSNGLQMPASPKDVIGPIWCAWGYGRDFTLQQVLETIPMAKKLGFEWVGLDDGWQEAIGDWQPNSKKFPGGEADFKRLVQEIHKHGMKVQLWWAPLAAHRDSRSVAKNPDRLLLKEDGKPRDITWWDSWYLCPAHTGVKNEVAALTRKFFSEWGIDGLKLDGQHLNASGSCFNPAHQHKNPAEAEERFSEIQATIFNTAMQLKPKALVEACPCGTSFSIYNLPFQNMTVASDPLSSVQVRQKGKVLRALTGDGIVFFGDHVELTRGDGDFASTIGVGGLVGSNFSLAHLNPPPPPPEDPVTILSSEREAHWLKWLKIAKNYPLWRGAYAGELYDIAFDSPEAHAVRLGEKMYYAFYAEGFTGQLELRGLKPGVQYKLKNYVEELPLGSVSGPVARINASFKKYFLIEASPAYPSRDSK